MKVLKGTAVSTGIAVGMVCLYADEHDEQVPHYTVSAEQVENEVKRLQHALKAAQASIRQLMVKSEKTVEAQALEIMQAHILILDDAGLAGKIESLIRDKKVNAEHAAADIFDEHIRFYAGKQMHFAELAHDFTDLKQRVLTSFGVGGGHFVCPSGERQAVVVAAQRLTPSMVLSIPREHVLAYVTEEGGYTTHATILARSLDIPVVFGIPVKDNLVCSTPVIVDGFTGQIWVEPDEETGRLYRRKQEELRKKKKVCAVRKQLPAHTRRRVRIRLKLNISTPAELDMVADAYHDGVGLLRTEFLFMDRAQPPSEDEQTALYTRLVKQVAPQPMVVRLLDIGSDKLPSFFILPEQKNPDLEIKGARAVGLFNDVYLAQVKALLRAGVHGDIRLLYPMVADAGDIGTFRELAAQARHWLNVEKKPYAQKVREGIMIETPSAALLADELLGLVDFANIGSNDLLQYTLAASRGNPLVEQRYHILHPALVRLIEIIARAGKKRGKEICLCGEIGSFPEFYPVLLRAGLRSFSVAAAQYEHIKCELLHTRGAIRHAYYRDIFKTKTKNELDDIIRKVGQG
jgi:phosphotransferase system enzyme I (PtsI)